MLRLDLLEDLNASGAAGEKRESAPRHDMPETGSEERGEPPRGPGPARRAFIALIALAIVIVAGAALTYFGNRDRFESLLDFGGHRAAAAAARADSLRTQALCAKASLAVDETLARSIEWLDQLETLPLEDSAAGKSKVPVSALSSFIPPDRFVLKGIARSEERISAIQEALVLLPGADLQESTMEKAADSVGGGFAYGFSGSVSLDIVDSLPAVDRTRPAARLTDELDSLRQAAAAAGIALSEPQAGPTSSGGGLEARSYRFTGTCDSTGLSGVRAFLDAERHRGSPFGVRRLTLDNQKGQQTLILDIMAFSR